MLDLIAFYNEMIGSVGEGGAADVYLDFSRAFHTASLNIINDLDVGTE